MSDEVAIALLRKDQDEIHLYTRLNFQLYIAWVTFWMTLNLGALSLTAPQASRHADSTRLWIAYTFFVIQNVFAVIGTAAVIRSFSDIGNRLDEIGRALTPVNMPAHSKPRAHRLVLRMYSRVLCLSQMTLILLAVCWLLVALVR